jgi:hypothetical protein
VFRCARCQYRVIGSALMEEARLSPPRLGAEPRGSVAGPFVEEPDDQHTRLHLPATDGEEEETALPAQLVADARSSVPPRASLPPQLTLSRFDAGRDEAEDQTRLHVAGSYEESIVPPPPADDQTRMHLPAALDAVPRRSQLPPPKHATLLGVPSPPRLSRFGAEPEDPDDLATRLHLADEPVPPQRSLESNRGQTVRGMPAIPPQVAPIARFDAGGDDADDQNTRLQVPINYEEEAPAPRLDIRSPVAPRMSMPAPEALPLSSGQRFAAASLNLGRWIDDWMRERHTVLLVTLAALCAIIAPVFDVVLGSKQQGATVIAANLALFFLWALGYAWLGKLRSDESQWDPGVAFTRISTSIRLALDDLGSFGGLPQPLRWRVVAEVSGAVGLLGLLAASALTLTHLVLGWPAGTGLLFLWRLFAGSCIVLAVIAAREAVNVPPGLSPAPDVTAPAVSHFPAVLDLSLPLTVPQTQAATPLHQVLEVLSQWEPRVWPNQDSYLAVLERHLLRRMGWARIERERPLGAGPSEDVAHLIVDESLLLEVVRGFDAEVAERVSSRMRRHARSWRGKPAMIIIFDASRSELMNGKGTPLLEALHHSYPMLAVRMPSASSSAA